MFYQTCVSFKNWINLRRRFASLGLFDPLKFVMGPSDPSPGPRRLPNKIDMIIPLKRAISQIF